MYEVRDGCLPVSSKDLLVDVPETAFMRYLFKIADSFGVINKLNKSTIRAIWYDGIGFDPYFDIFFHKNLIDKCDELHGHILLS